MYTPVPSGYSRCADRTSDLRAWGLRPSTNTGEEIKMKKVFLWVSTGIVFTISGCSGNSETTVLESTPAVVQASAPTTRDITAANNASPVAEPAAALPVPSVGRVNQQAWRSENVRDHFGDATVLKETSSDGKFDL